MSNRLNRKKHRAAREHEPRTTLPICPACGKKCYATRKLAAAALKARAYAVDVDPDDFNYYRCASGNGEWHFGRRSGIRHRDGEPPRPVPPNERTSHAD